MLEKWPAFIAVSYVNLLSVYSKALHVIFLYIYVPTHLITPYTRNICAWMNWKCGGGAQGNGENIANLQGKWKWKLFCPDLHFATPWTVACRFLYSWNFPGKNIGVGSHSLLQDIFPTRDQTQILCTADRFFTNWATRDFTGNSLKVSNFGKFPSSYVTLSFLKIAQLWSLIGELKSHKLCDAAKNK